VLAFQISGGTGRFIDASGGLTLSETVAPVLADALNNTVFLRVRTNSLKRSLEQPEADHQEEAIGSLFLALYGSQIVRKYLNASAAGAGRKPLRQY
jgi:hypothetical protein